LHAKENVPMSFLRIALLTVVIVLYALLSLRQANAAPSPALEAAALSANWNAVLALVEADAHADGTVRHLGAHALLASNRANEASCLFVLAAADHGQDMWLAWTADLIQ